MRILPPELNPPREPFKPDRQAIHKEWVSFLDMVKSSNGAEEVPHAQIVECRRAFYGGAMAMYAFTVAKVTELSDDDAEAQMEALRDELMKFRDDMLAGKK